MKNKIVVGTRGSILALKQTEIVISKLKSVLPDIVFEIKKIKTTGDMRSDIPLKEESESVKKMFVKEIENELLEGSIDIAVHSMKDIADFAAGTILGAVLEREDPRDVFISKGWSSLYDLPSGAVVGTGSIRREIQLRNLRHDIEIREIRGNIHTRIEKMERGEYDAIILAAAGLNRAGLQEKISGWFSPEEITPAPAQGIICVQCRENDNGIIELLKNINNRESMISAVAERKFSALFNGGCKVPVGAVAEIKGDRLILSGIYFDGNRILKGKCEGSADAPEKCAEQLAAIILG